MRISDWSSDVCSSDLARRRLAVEQELEGRRLTREQVVGVRHGHEFDALAGRLEQRRRRLADGDEDFVAVVRFGGPDVARPRGQAVGQIGRRSEEHTSELQSLMRISYAVFCFKKKKQTT